MNISSHLMIHMPQSQSVSTFMLQANTTPPANPYNSQVDGFVTRTLLAGFSGKNMSKLVFEDASGTEGLSGLTKNVFLKQAAVSAGMGAGIYAGLSVLKQGWGMMKGTQDARGAAANIITDSLRGGATGLGGAAGGGVTAMAMKAIGATGLFGTIVSSIGGAVGGTIGANLIESTGIRNRLVTSFGSSKANPAPAA